MSGKNDDKTPDKKRRKKRCRRSSEAHVKELQTNMAAAGAVPKNVNVNKPNKEQPTVSTGQANAANVPSSNVFQPPKLDFPMHFQPPPPPGPYWSQPQQITNIHELTAKLDHIMSKLQKLDSIEAQQANILSRLNNIELNISENRRKIENTDKKVTDIETSQKFISDQYEGVAKLSNVNKQELHKVQAEVKKLSDENKLLSTENETLKKDNVSMAEDILDIKCRSMQDNLVFMGIPEHTDPHVVPTYANQMEINQSQQEEDPDQAQPSQQATAQATFAHVVASGEDCASKVLEFCETVLKIDNARNRIQIDRAHRMGNKVPGKIRAIVVKFKETKSKMIVKEALRTINLKESPFGVFDQYPKAIQERRKALIPVMLQARRADKSAFLVRDKLYVNNRPYIPSSD